MAFMLCKEDTHLLKHIVRLFSWCIILSSLLRCEVWADITSNLQGHWRFNETSGTNAPDATVNNNPGTLQGGATWGTGQAGQSVVLDGVNDYVSVGTGAALNITGTALTLAAWVRIDGNNGGLFADTYHQILGKDDHASIIQYRLLLANARNALLFQANNGAIQASSSSFGSFALGSWHHVLASFDGSTVAFYVDGQSVSTVNAAGSITSTVAGVALGRTSIDYYYLNGRLDEARVYVRALTSADAQELFTDGGGTTPPAGVKAFPTAEGWGKNAVGGRGGKAYLINSLAKGAGTGGSCNAGGCSGGTITFQDCTADRFLVGRRTCIFRVGGTIDISDPTQAVSLEITKPYITIAGQTAPGDGIMIRGGEVLFFNTNDVIVRHLRVRTGPYDPGRGTESNIGALELLNSQNVIFDHCSTSWSEDDQTGAWTQDVGPGVEVSNDITYQWCLMGHSLHDPPASGGPDYAKAMIIGGNGNTHRVSVLHNLFVGLEDRVPFHQEHELQYVNNVIYNVPGDFNILPFTGPVQVEVVNNYFEAGPAGQGGVAWAATAVRNLGLCWNGPACDTFNPANLTGTSIYVSGNMRYQNGVQSTANLEFNVVYQGGGGLPTQNTTPWGFPTIADQTSHTQAKTDVLAKAGARVPILDVFDTRMINEFNTLTGSNIFYQVSDDGGYPTYASGTPYTDTDSDGMSDTYETAHGLNPNDAADGPAISANGYSNLENFLNELAGDPPVEPGASVPTITRIIR